MDSKPRLQLRGGLTSRHDWERCSSEGQDCELLVTDPLAFFRREQLPTHLCEYTRSWLLEAWILRRKHQMATETAQRWWIAACRWPCAAVPVGSKAITSSIESRIKMQNLGLPNYRPVLANAFEVMDVHTMAVFGGHEDAALIVEYEAADLWVELYFLVEPDTEALLALDPRVDPVVTTFMPSDLKVRISGSDRDGSSLGETAKTVVRAHKWWTRTMAGLRILGTRGRPAGRLGWALREIEALRNECRAEPGHDDFTLEQFVGWLNDVRNTKPDGVPSKNTVARRVQDTGLGFRAWWSQARP